MLAGMTDRSAVAADTSLHVSLPEALKEYVQRRVAEGAFSDPGDHVGALIREDRKRQAEARLEALLLEGLDSGPATPMTAEDWREIRAEVEAHIAKRRQDSA
jgi:antitoxin ParD1/3/4